MLRPLVLIVEIIFNVYKFCICLPFARAPTYKTSKVTGGGDWEWDVRCAGLTGPNWKHFCFHSKLILSDTKNGKPHALHILPKYQTQTTGHSRVLPPNDDFFVVHQGDQITDTVAKFRATGDKAVFKGFWKLYQPTTAIRYRYMWGNDRHL